MSLGIALTLYRLSIIVAMAEMSSFQLWREADQERATTEEFSEGATTVDFRILSQFCSLTVDLYLSIFSDAQPTKKP